MRKPIEGRRSDVVPTAVVATSVNSLHRFTIDGEIVEVEVFQVDEKIWAEVAASFGTRLSAIPIGEGRLRIVRVTA